MKTFLRWCVLGIGLISGCTNSQSKSTKGDAPDRSAICENASQDFSCAQKVEQEYLRYYADLVTKEKEHTLVLKLKNGKTKVYVDVLSESYETAISYNFVDYLDSLNFYVLRMQYYEGCGFLLIDQKDGQEYPIGSFPILSPNGAAFVCTYSDVAAQYNLNSIQVWHMSDRKPVLAYEFNPEKWGPSDAVWDGNNRIKISRMGFDQNAFKEIALPSTQLNMVEGRWKLQ